MNKILAFLFMCLITSNTSANETDIKKIENYLNNIISLEANFVQMSSNGATAEGKIYISKPSKIRMEYTVPDSISIIGNGDFIVYNDKELDQVTNIDYEDIPATMILTEKIKLNGDKLKVSDYYKDNGQTSITVETIDNPDIKPITLIFENNPFQLKQWKIIDQQNIEITISLFNMEKDKKLDEQLFNYKQKISNKKPINRRK
jgi:outer membrane lipoprotein-sorting protein